MRDQEPHPNGSGGLAETQAVWRRVLRAPGAYLTEDTGAPPLEPAHLALAFGALVDEEDEDARRLLGHALPERGHGGGSAGPVALAFQAVLMTRLGSPLAVALQREAEAATDHELETTWVALAAA